MNEAIGKIMANSKCPTQEYIVTHLPLPPYTVKKWEEVVILCAEHGKNYVDLVLELGGRIRKGKDVDEMCEKCKKDVI